MFIYIAIYQRGFNITQKNQLPVINEIDINGEVLLKESVSYNGRKSVSYEITEWTVSWVLYLYNVLQFIVDGFNQWPFLSKILLAMLISEFFISFFTLMTSKLYTTKRQVLK